MSVAENKELVRKWVDATNRQDIASLIGFLSPELAVEWTKTIAWVYTTYKGHHATIIDIIAEDDRVWFRLATGGDHLGDHQPGNSRTGQPWKNQGIYCVRMSDSRIVAIESFIYDTPKPA